MYGQDVFDPEVCVLAAAENQSMKNGGHYKLLVGRQRIQNREFWCSRISPGILNILDLNEKYSRRSKLRELFDIWNYRANLSQSTQRQICPPNGCPFLHININTLNQLSEENIKKKFIKIIKKFIYSSSNIEQRKLGAVYVLSALTLVNVQAASAMPWLYESVMHQ